ncbi:MAG: hypothetical protein ACKUBY_05295 [Candidatus Moraniibacteriota bacterium]|jgi:hypothetical protein
MGRILKTFIKHCSYCNKDFGCTSADGITKKCDTCDTEYGSASCSINSMFTVISHGICTENCFITSLDPQMAKRYMESANA